MSLRISGGAVIAHALKSLTARVLPVLIGWGTPLFRRHLLPVLTHLLTHLLALFRCQPNKVIAPDRPERRELRRGQYLNLMPKHRKRMPDRFGMAMKRHGAGV